MIRKKDELAKMRKAGKVVAEMHEVTRAAIRPGVTTKQLNDLAADVLTKRFGLGDDEERTFREIGDHYHLSRERIRQIQNSALDKLKRALEREHRGHVEM